MILRLPLIHLASIVLSVMAIAPAGTAVAAERQDPHARPAIPFTRLAALADTAKLVAHVEILRVAPLEPGRAVGVEPGHVRLYVEARTKALLTGRHALQEAVRYLVDVPSTRTADLRRRDMLLFASRDSPQTADLRLVTPTAQLPWSPQLEARLRPLLQSLASPDAPPTITGVREYLHVPGNLAGQGRTQIFLETIDGSAASITVRRRPGAPPLWGVSFNELAANFENQPSKGTLAWYRLACSLPALPPANANVSLSAAAQLKAVADYSLVLQQLGPCAKPGPLSPQAKRSSCRHQSGPMIDPA